MGQTTGFNRGYNAEKAARKNERWYISLFLAAFSVAYILTSGLVDQLYDRTNRIRSNRYSVAEKRNNPSVLQIMLEEDVKKALVHLSKNEL